MATLVMPSAPGISRTRFGTVYNTHAHMSSFDKSTQTGEMTGARWFATYELPPMKRAEAGTWKAFLMQGRGRAGRFFGFDADAKTPLGSALGTPLVDGAGQTGATLNTKGWTASQSGLLLPGDYFEFDGQLKMVAAQVDSDGSGDAAIAFEPPIRNSPADNAPLTTSNAACTMMLIDDNQAAWDITEMQIYGFSFSGIEVFV
ncbi:MAG: hypothetical protein ACTSWM_07265 [Alphaproteobacteria bacterium]